jgi:hypothetical protein
LKAEGPIQVGFLFLIVTAYEQPVIEDKGFRKIFG